MSQRIEWVRSHKLDQPLIDPKGNLWHQICQVPELWPAIQECYDNQTGLWKNIIEREIHHWSRIFEYPWVMTYGDFKASQWVLDAAGGDAPLQRVISDRGAQIINIDLNQPPPHRNVIAFKGDIQNIDMVDNIFDRVLCISVLEHVDDPLKAIKELWRVLKPGGRLMVTMDIASYSRWNHTVDKEYAQRLLDYLGMQIPPEPDTVKSRKFAEVQRLHHEPDEVELKVLCFFKDKIT